MSKSKKKSVREQIVLTKEAKELIAQGRSQELHDDRGKVKKKYIRRIKHRI